MSDYYVDSGGAAPPADTSGGFVGQLPSILWQRRWWIIVPAVLAAVGAVLAVVLLPRKYESAATLLVQSPTLPTTVIGSGDDSDIINRRVERLRQQVISRPKLLSLIETNELYTKERARKPLSTVIDDMRDSIELTSIDADLNTTRPEDRTIAFKLSYSYPDPVKAQAVTQALMEQIVELNSTADVAQANQTVQFLTEQSSNLKRDIGALEQQISGINLRFGGILSRSNAPVLGGGSASYDIQIAELTRANQALQMQKQDLGTASTRDPVVAQAEAGLAAARAVYADDHPDVKIARQRLEEAKQLAKQNVKKLPAENLDQQIAFNNSQLATLRAAKARESAQVSATLSSQSQAPAVQQTTAQLQQKLDTLYKQYDAVSERLMTAQAGARAANEQLGERLVVVDPPVVPDEPASPNRLLILGGGIGAGLVLGLLLGLGVEMFLQPIRTPGRIAQLTGAPTLAMVPVIVPRSAPRETGRRWMRNPFRRRAREEQAA
jgi:polysaccharide biosynthesis transport protein